MNRSDCCACACSKRILAYMSLLVAACTPAPQEYINPSEAFDQIRSVIRDFGIANEFHYAAESTFSDDLAELQIGHEWPHADSVDLRVTYVSSDGWTAVATHKRLGPSVGCAMAWGTRGSRLPLVSTPAGAVFAGGNKPTCDVVAEAR